MVKDFMVVDRNDNFYDIYIFKKSYKVEDIEKVIKNHKKEFVGEWTMESIELAIKNTFEVEYVIHCDNIKGNIMEV